MAHLPRDEVGEDRKQKRWRSLKEALVFYSVETVIGRARSSTRRERESAHNLMRAFIARSQKGRSGTRSVVIDVFEKINSLLFLP